MGHIQLGHSLSEYGLGGDKSKRQKNRNQFFKHFISPYLNFIGFIFWVGHLLPKVYYRIRLFQGQSGVFEKALSWRGIVVGKRKKVKKRK
ncbi:MAG TPA: hypothetical protein DCL49_12855 [Candidatus Omnitrophica bacterium]|nr:hypothetical protein [Candidatus Omnitrophota bacterium]